MELFHNTTTIRLKSHHDKYLVAEKDEESVSQDRKGSSKTAGWNVEFVQGRDFIRLRSCYGKYLTASDAPFRLGVTGKKVVQTLPQRLDSESSIEWEPIRDGHNHIKLKTRCGDYLRANGGVPPWRNSVTHDVPHRTSTQYWILWEVIDILDIQQIKPVVVAKPPKEEKEAKPIKPVVVLKRPKEEKEAKSKEENKEEEEGEEEEEEESSEEEEEGSEEGGEGSQNSRFGFRKLLHKLKGGGSDGEEEKEEGEGEGGSPSSRFGFRKFLHNLKGGDGGEDHEGEGEGEGEGEEGEEVEVEFEFEF